MKQVSHAAAKSSLNMELRVRNVSTVTLHTNFQLPWVLDRSSIKKKSRQSPNPLQNYASCKHSAAQGSDPCFGKNCFFACLVRQCKKLALNQRP